MLLLGNLVWPTFELFAFNVWVLVQGSWGCYRQPVSEGSNDSPTHMLTVHIPNFMHGIYYQETAVLYALFKLSNI